MQVVILFLKVRKQEEGMQMVTKMKNVVRFKGVKFLAKMNAVREKN